MTSEQKEEEQQQVEQQQTGEQVEQPNDREDSPKDESPVSSTTPSLPPLRELPESSPPPPPALTRRATAGSRARAHSAPYLARRQSTHERINAILETARERAEALSASQPQSQFQSQSPTPPQAGASPRMEPLLRGRSAPGTSPGAVAELDSSADEAAGIVMRGAARGSSHLNYQTLSPGGAESGARPRKSGGPRSRSSGTDAAQSHGAGAGSSAGGAGALDVAADEEEKEEEKWWRKLLRSFQSLELENKGSVARDHLALERTFLAWLRTSLAFASIGIAITQLFRLNTSSMGGGSSGGSSGGSGSSENTLRQVGKPLGTTFLAISILILFLGYNRYHQSQEWLLKGKFPASRGTVLLLSLAAFGLMVASLVVVVVVQPAQTES